MIIVEINGRKVRLEGPEADRVIRLAQAKMAAEEAAELAARIKWQDILFPTEDAVGDAVAGYGLSVMFIHEIRFLARKGEEVYTIIVRRDEEPRVTPGDHFKAPGRTSGRAGSTSTRAGKTWGWKTNAPTEAVKQAHRGAWRGVAVALRSKATREALQRMGYSVWQE